MLGGGASGAILNHLVFNRPKIRLRSSIGGIARMQPVVTFSLTNARRDEVHVSSITTTVKKKGKIEQRSLSTKPSTGKSFRIRGLEQETFEVGWEDIFPDGDEVDELIAVHVEDIATEKRWRLPQRDLKQVREGIRETLTYRREKATWSLTCQSCKATVSWKARRPRPTGSGGFTYDFGFPEHKGWTNTSFDPYMIDGDGLCPKCTVAEQTNASETVVAD
jgi:hypothetical protein